MRLFASSKLLCALLAVVAIGSGAQTYYLVQVHNRLEAAEVRAAEAATSAAVDDTKPERDQTALVPADPLPGLAPADPFPQFGRAEERMRSLFDDFYDRFDSTFGDPWFNTYPLFADGDSFRFGAGHVVPRVDLQDRGDHYEMIVDLPGSDETDVIVRTEGDLLIVEGSRDSTLEESEPGNYVRRERRLGRFERRLTLPSDADTETLQTEVENGVLRVSLRKRS